jgi:hypothetical protein
VTGPTKALSKRELLRMEYRSHMGVTEATGNNDGYWVEKFLAAVGLGKGNPWCAAFVKYCFDRIGIKTTITAWSPTSTPPARRIWQEGKILKRLPTFGDVFSIYYPKMGRIGHTGFVDEWKPDSPYVLTCEGNTNAQNSREGNGAFSRKRLKRQLYAVANWID